MFCTDIPSPIALIFSDSTPHLLYYSHLPVAFTALLIGLLVFSKSKSLEAKLLLTLVGLFLLWILIDLITWTNVDSRLIMLVWSVMYFTSILIAAFTLYFSYVFLEKKDAPFKAKLIGVLFLTPFLFLLPSGWNINVFDLALCEAEQGPLLYYFYFLQIVFLFWTAGYFIQKYKRTSPAHKQTVLYPALGGLFFIAAFFGGNFIGSMTLHWEWEQYGLFGMFIFMSFLVYLIVRYEAFNIKVLAVQALMGAFIILIGSQFFFATSTLNVVLIAITFILSLVFAYFLIQSIKREVERKEELQEISNRLAIANERLRELDNAKSEFISIASHQLRTPLTAIKGYISLLLEGSYGELDHTVQDVLNKVYIVNGRLTQLVEDLLNISRIEAGRIQYNYQPNQLEAIVAELVDMFALTAKKKNLSLKMELPKQPLPQMLLDPNKIKEVLSNLLDNSLKYTIQGGVTVTVEEKNDLARIIVSDTGIGIHPEDAGRLFEKFIRTKETTKMAVSGTGLGLYVGRNFVEGHGGRIFAESEGAGKGSRFIVELPIHNPKVKKGVATAPAPAPKAKRKA